MKKIIIVLFLFTIVFLINNKEEEFIIPDNAIRFRVIANSNTFEDQKNKMEIKTNIENILKKEMSKMNSKENTQQIVNQKIPEIKQMINNYAIPYEINYGNNYFPEKKYRGITYEEGIYESLVVTLGKGNGDNWWCVLFPPLCLMETSFEEAEDVEYQFFVKKMFNKYM